MSTTTMHFGPEWMRTKHHSSSKILQTSSPEHVQPALPPGAQPEKRDERNSFRYSKEEMLRIYREQGSRVNLGSEVERWEGVIREAPEEPVGLRAMTDAEKKLFSGPLNSELRRRQSSDYLSPLQTTSDRPRLNHHSSSGLTSPLRERFGGMSIKRRDSTDQPSSLPRRLSLSSTQSYNAARDPALPSPRVQQTRGFDGVLNGNSSDIWSSRRKVSDGLMKQSATNYGQGGGDFIDSGAGELKIKEEDEEAPSQLPAQEHPNMLPASSSSHDAISISGGGTDIAQNFLDPSGINISQHQAPNGQHHSASPASSTVSGHPTSTNSPATLDLTSVEWSYLDPQGNVQGPFKADLMQKWHDDGYFTPDLLVKRTYLDNDWISVALLSRNATDKRIFLAPPVLAAPPGLTSINHIHHAPLSEQNLLSGPFQPSPIRSLRSSTLDSYLTSMSNPSDSPASSFGAGRFGTDSPDLNAFGGRMAGVYPPVETSGIHSSSYPLGSEIGSSMNGRRNVYGDASFGIGSPSSIGLSQGRPSSNEGFHYNNFPSQNAWQPSADGNYDRMPSNSLQADTMPYSSSFGQTGSGLDQQQFLHESNIATSSASGLSYVPTDYHISQTHEAHQTLNRVEQLNVPGFSNYSGFSQSQNHLSAPQGSVQHFVTAGSNAFNQHDTSTQNLAQNASDINKPDAASVNWTSMPDIPETRRHELFGPTHPTASNTIAVPSPWSHPTQAPQHGYSIDDVQWPPAGADAPSNVLEVVTGVPHAELQVVSPVSEGAVAPVELVLSSSENHGVPAKPRTKSVSKQPSASTQIQVVSAVSIPVAAIESTTPISPAPKAAWARDDEQKKGKPSGLTLSLRDIQEAEARNAEARKTAEKETERTPRVAAPSNQARTTDDVQFTASWGLPTSQAGRSNNVPPAKEVPTSPTPPQAPWTTGVKPGPKKTMKQIQEEEEKRKKAAVKESVAAVAAKRGYSESANKQPAGPQGNAWTTVGPSGKIAPAPAAVSRPPTTPSSSVPSTSSIARANGAVISKTTPSGATKSISKPDESSILPSHDFMKWLAENLRGLNNSVNVEEISSMLLSFPLDPDPSTVEIISDLIYANSTTLDGRRFAAEFISKRKADAVNRPKGVTMGKPISIADVVKSQPKPATSEWGGFKVVNKKKKGGRT